MTAGTSTAPIARALGGMHILELTGTARAVANFQ